MNRILKFKDSILTRVAKGTEFSANGLLRDTKFVLYCFRHYKHVDNAFNYKVSNIILNNLHKYEKPADKSKAISLFVQVHLVNNLKISPSQSQMILENLQNTTVEVPNLRWLVNLALVFHNSDINNQFLWDYIEKHYLNQLNSQPSSEELLKLAYVMSTTPKQSPMFWKKLISDIISREDVYNSSQKVMLLKTLTKVKFQSFFDEDFISNKFKPYIMSLIDSNLKQKELLTLRELVAVLLSSEKIGNLTPTRLTEIEEKLFEKPGLISKKNIYEIMKIYGKLELTKERKVFLRNLRKILLSKYDKKIDYRDALNFNIINNFMHKNGIIPTQEFNEPYTQFILEDKFEIFEQLFVARMKTSSIIDVMNFSVLIQGHLSKHILQLNPYMFLKILNFFETRGEISPSFLQLTFDVCKKYLEPVQEKHWKQQIYAYAIFVKYNPSYVKGPKLVGKAKDTVERLKDLNDQEITSWVIQFISNNQPDLPADYVKIVKGFYEQSIGKLTEESLYETFSVISRKDLQNLALKEKIEEILANSFKYMKTSDLCKSYHLIQATMSPTYVNLAEQNIQKATLSLNDLEYLVRRVEILPPHLLQHVQTSFNANKKDIDWRSAALAGNVILKIFKSGKMFDKAFIQGLMETVSAYQGYFNQKILDKLIGAYSNTI